MIWLLLINIVLKLGSRLRATGLLQFKEARDGNSNDWCCGDHPTIMAVGVFEGTSKAVFRTFMLLGLSRSEWDFRFYHDMVGHLDSHTYIIHIQLCRDWPLWRTSCTFATILEKGRCRQYISNLQRTGSKEDTYAGSMKRDLLENGILISGCQTHETSADATPSGKPLDTYGALNNAIQTIIEESDDTVGNHELVTKARMLLKKQGFT